MPWSYELMTVTPLASNAMVARNDWRWVLTPPGWPGGDVMDPGEGPQLKRRRHGG